jgi:uncharacterized protein YjbI with pentapeptide repeats
VSWWLLVPAADWLARHDVGAVKGPLLQTARDAARGRLLTLGAGLFAAGALLFTARNFILSREGQVTDRYTKAIEQLGSDKPDVRIGGVYALERVARDSARDHPTVMEVLSAFIREHSPVQLPPPDTGNQEQVPVQRLPTPPDVQAAITVIGRRDAKRDIRPLDLHGVSLYRADIDAASLTSADFHGADLAVAQLARANLTDASLADAILAAANLAGANLTGANLAGADLTEADLHGANLTHADLDRADLTRAVLAHAILSDTDLTGANLTGANLTGANLTEADLHGANLTHADLDRADLTRAVLAYAILSDTDLTGANLAHAFLANTDFSRAELYVARWPEDKFVPEGWVRDAGSGLLWRANQDTDAGN